MDNYPYNHQQTWYYVAVAEDAFGNATPDADLCVFEATVLDGTQPTICLAQVGTRARPSRHRPARRRGGSARLDHRRLRLPADRAAAGPLRRHGRHRAGSAASTASRALPGSTTTTTARSTRTTSTATGSSTRVDDAGVDGIPGTNDDEWNGSALAAGGSNLGETDDYVTNDIVKVVFQMNPVGGRPGPGLDHLRDGPRRHQLGARPGHRLDRAGQGDLEHPRPADRRLRPAGVGRGLGRELQRAHGVHHDRRHPEQPAARLHPAGGLHERPGLRPLRRALHPRLRDRQGPLRVLLRRQRRPDAPTTATAGR